MTRRRGLIWRDMLEIWTVSCPDNYPSLPVRQGLPQLQFNTTTPAPGSFVQLQIYDFSYAGPMHLAWLSGPAVTYTDINSDMVAAVPQDLQGVAFAVVVPSTTSDDFDSDILTGFAVVDCIFNSHVPNPGPQYSDSD